MDRKETRWQNPESMKRIRVPSGIWELRDNPDVREYLIQSEGPTVTVAGNISGHSPPLLKERDLIAAVELQQNRRDQIHRISLGLSSKHLKDHVRQHQRTHDAFFPCLGRLSAR